MSIANKDSVLIVEDDAEYGALLTRVIKKMGLWPLLTTTVAQARGILARTDVRLIVLDRLLGKGGDGLALCLELKKDPRTRPIPVIVLTGMLEACGELKGYRYGADIYLRKPFCMEEFRGYITSFLKRLPYKDEIQGRIILGNVVIDSINRSLAVGDRIYQDLPARQFSFLVLLAAHQGKAVSREYLVKKLWPNPVLDREVDVLVSRLKRRLGKNAAACIVSVRSYGYRLEPSFPDKNSIL